MTNIPHNIGKYIFGQRSVDGVEFQMPVYIWHHWPLKTSNDNGLLWLRNTFFHRFHNVSWHSARHFPQFISLRYRAMQAICNGDIDTLESCLAEGWDPNSTVDHLKRFNGASLAAYLDNLEVLHCLDLHGADLSGGGGKFGNTPLMTALTRWNVRIIDYLMERGVDPTVVDTYGFTAKRKAEIKNLRTISSMLEQYEQRYTEGTSKYLSPITNSDWETTFAHHYTTGDNARARSSGQQQSQRQTTPAQRRRQAKRQRKESTSTTAKQQSEVRPVQYKRVEVRPLNNEISTFQPSQLIQEGEYPFTDFYQNSMVLTFVGNFHFFRSADVKQVA